jgi:hypothetical protein
MTYKNIDSYDIYGEDKIIKEDIDTSIYENEFIFDHKNIFQTFCSLVHRTYPYGTEEVALNYIGHDLNKDKHGNFFVKIGESNTMFSSHLDSATSKVSKVELVTYIDKNEKFISTKGNTILGADDKAGVTIMLYMIENKIPGLYYFFIGEESGGIGSYKLATNNNNSLKNIKRCVAFDRRGYNSVITHQMMSRCCSDVFANALCEEFNKHGMKLRKDDTGIFTDSANFVGLIPECTNISVGYYNEHTSKEYQNLTYLENLCEAVLKVDWENLPTVK